jgi:hypothetical protein
MMGMSISDIVLLSLVPLLWTVFILRAWRAEADDNRKSIWRDDDRE